MVLGRRHAVVGGGYWARSRTVAFPVDHLGRVVLRDRAGGPARPGDCDAGEDARRIVDERLARGEIDAEEYQRLRDIIGSD